MVRSKGEGDRVAFLDKNCTEHPELMAAAAKPVRVDSEARVLDTATAPIEGLFRRR